NRLESPDAFERTAEGYFLSRLSRVYRRYQSLLRDASAVDFDDMIAKAVELLQTQQDIGGRVRARLKYLLVDEYQDTNHAQLALIRELIGREGNLTAVGDEDQGIYRWRGAEI